jgi:hypothetical protein
VSTLQDPSRNESIRLWPLWVSIGCPLLLIVLNSTPITTDFAFVVMGLPALWLAWVCVGVCAAIFTVRWLWQRAWRQAVIGAVLPLAILGAGLHFIAFIHSCDDAGDIVHFVLMRPSYLKAIRATPPHGEARLLTFNLGGMNWAPRGFVYDESDEVLRAPSLQSLAWKARAQNSELSCDDYQAQPFPGHLAFTRHWYLVSFPC